MEQDQIIPIENLPFDQFKLLGMEKKDVLALPKWTMDALRSGNRTSLIQFNNIRPNGLSEAVTINAKLSLQKDGDSYKLKMHPVNLQPRNDLELSPKEIEFLKKDPLNILPKKVVDSKGKLINSFISLDRSTNEYIPVNRDSLKPPEAINDIYLNEAQKKDFVNGRPIQLEKGEYRMDVNSENGVSGKNVEKIKFRSGEYNAYNLLLDAALMVSGLGVLVMVEHLAKMVFNNREKVHDLMAQDLKPAIRRTVSDITEKANNGIQLSNRDKNELLVINVRDTLIKQPEIKPTVEQKAENPQIHRVGEANLSNFTYSGRLLEYGPAPYEFNKENKDNYFVKLGTDAGERLVWGVDFGRAVQESGARTGDHIGVDHAGTQAVKVNVDKKDMKGEVTGTEERTIDRNNWNIQVLGSGNKVEQSKTNSMTKGISDGVPQKTGQTGAPDPHDIIVVRFDPTDNLERQQSQIAKQITEQLSKYDGKGMVLVGREMTALAPEGHPDANKINSDIDRLRGFINEEVHRQIDSVRIVTYDQIKIANPRQRQMGETKAALASDNNKQSNDMENTKKEIKQNVIEIKQVKSGRRR